MIEVLFILSTILFGSSVILLIRQSMWTICLHTILGWLMGSMITGIFVTILTHFVELTDTLVFELMGAQIIFSVAALLLLYIIRRQDFKHRMKINVEKSPWLFLSLTIAGCAAVYFSEKFYRRFPKYIPKQASYELELEHSVIQSLIGGCNAKHPKLYSLEDPFLFNSLLKKSPITYAFSACLVKVSGSFYDASILICFLNTLATVCAFYPLAATFTSYHTTCILILLFNGGWGFIKYFRVHDVHVDLVHDWGREYSTPFYQILFKFLVASKEASFALPIAIFAVSLTTTPKKARRFSKVFLIAGIMSALCPSFMTSAALFILATCNYNSFIEVVPFALTLLIKYRNAAVVYMPLWKEYQMNGVFFSQLKCWFEGFGPVVFAVFLFPFIVRDSFFFHKCLTALCPLAFCSFFRNGGYYEDSALAVAGTVFPIYVVAIVHIYQKYIKEAYGNKRGFILGVGAAIVTIMVASGYMSCKRSTSQLTIGIPESAMIIKKWIRKHSLCNSITLTPFLNVNPVTFLTGRRIVVGSPAGLWRRGEKYSKVLNRVKTTFGWKAVENMMREYGAGYLLSSENVDAIDSNLFTLVESSNEWCLLKLKE
jgi:hypothetical protein